MIIWSAAALASFSALAAQSHLLCMSLRTHLLHSLRRRLVTRRALAKAEPPPLPARRFGGVSAVRAVPLKLILFSKSSTAFDAAVAEYTSRLSRYTAFEELVLKPNPRGAAAGDAASQMAAESERLVKSVGARDRLVLLDERGRDLDSLQLAELLRLAGEEGVASLVFAIGGPHGHGPAARERADDCLKLSSMVFNHQVARLVLAEQLYRAWTILKGEPYHHA